MRHEDTVAALASSMPAGIRFRLADLNVDWRAAQIAEFQAERLAEAGYVLIYTGLHAEAGESA